MAATTPPIFPDVALQARTPTTWIPDSRVHRCFSCNTQFSMLRRKHHCRSCGRIFCSSCSAYRETIPSYYRSYAPSPSQSVEPQRTCAPCANKLRRAADVEWLVRALAVMPVPFHKLFDLRIVNRAWNHAVNMLLSLYQGLQYRLPCQEYTRVECDFLWSHYSEFGGHLPWQIHTFACLKSFDLLRHRLGVLRAKPKIMVPCRWLLCSAACRPSMSVDNIIHLGMSGCLEHDIFISWVIESWKRFQPVVHIKMMPWWVYIGLKYPKLFKHGLVPLCVSHIDLMYTLWFECLLQGNSRNQRFLDKVRSKILGAVSQGIQDDVSASMAFIQCMKRLVAVANNNAHDEIIEIFFKIHPSVRAPWSPSQKIIFVANTKRFLSKTRPLRIRCVLESGQHLDVLIKTEDVRTDRLAMDVGYWIESLTDNIHVHGYPVFPFDKESGCVVMIPDAMTVYDIRRRTTLLNHVLSCNQDMKVSELRENIVSSCVGACLLAFTMGLGDRHLENIMVTRKGHLTHVDFGYVLGEDPKNIATPMRITEDMVEAIGGRASSSFAAFIKRTQVGYEHMRAYASFWYHLLAAEFYIFGDKSRHWKRIRDHVLDRFVPGELDEEASLHIQTVVQRATNDSVVQRLADFAHLASNQLVGGIFQMDL